jgi:alkaline phosphatase D
MGMQQEAWLADGLDKSPATWQILANQVFMAQQDNTNGAGESYNMDAWDGYKANRDRLLNFVNQKGGLNPIVVTGDVHANWAADLLADFSNPQSKILGSEFVGTSISTTGDGADTGNAARLTENPWIKFNQQQRGYVRVALSPTECRGDFRVVPYVKRPGAPISTRKSYVVQAGHPGLQDA